MKVTERFGYAPAGRAFSRESVFVPGAQLPADLDRFLTIMDELYYRWIPRLTGGAVAIVGAGEGEAARVIPFGPTGLLLGPPTIRGARVEREIRGGWLVGEPGGTLAEELVPKEGGVEAAVSLDGFFPRILVLPFGRRLYDVTQARIHRRLSRGYLRHDVAPRLYRPTS